LQQRHLAEIQAGGAEVKTVIAAMLASLFFCAPAFAETKSAVFAGGCFWSMEKAFEETPGVTGATSGFSGGTVPNPTYQQVVNGGTGHLEAVKVDYDPAKVSYEQLLMTYWHSTDPTDAQGQFCDKGDNYHTAIFYGSDEEKALAEKTKATVEAQLKQSVVTQILPAMPFYPAEDYHQDFYKKNPDRYDAYRIGCGRDRRKAELWGKKE
jgi:peptide-methionine (S)-S-oxide reductase